ncbi:MAG: hypothetical protein JNG88_03125 [Phycisphaerales bacterium]|nr:hypothetical protein [Phycisphaerales bacterium]
MADSIIQFFGRLHPMVLHVPIGVLVALLILELGIALRQIEIAQRVRIALAGLLAASAVVAAMTGWILSNESSYGGETLDRHFWLGLLTAGFSASLFGWSFRPRFYGAYITNLFLIAVAIAAAGHLGAELTHGANWLWAPFRPSQRPAAQPMRAASAAPATTAPSQYSLVVAPIFEKHCVECHGEEKNKARLRLDTYEAILAGSDQGAVIDQNSPAESELLRRLLLPSESDERMPPGENPPLTPEELDAIRAWIMAGASR